MIPDATGYVRLAKLEWASEVAKAARGTTSVATNEPPAHAPHVCDPVTDPAKSALVDHNPLEIVGHGRRHEHEPEAAAHELVAASCRSEGPDAFLTDHRRGKRPPRVKPHPRDHQHTEIKCHIIARSRSILAPSGAIVSFVQRVGLTYSSVGVSLADQSEDRTSSVPLGEIHDPGREAMNVYADSSASFVHLYRDVVVSPAHHFLCGPGLPFRDRARLASRYPDGSRTSLRPDLPGQFAPPVASMSRATAAVQDCSLDPSASPVNGSKYSAKPPSESSSRVSRRIF